MDVPSVIELFHAHGAPDPDELFEPGRPALRVMGGDDALERSRALHERIAGSELTVIAGAGHACHVEQPAAWSERVRAFLEQRTDGLAPTPAGMSGRP